MCGREAVKEYSDRAKKVFFSCYVGNNKGKINITF